MPIPVMNTRGRSDLAQVVIGTDNFVRVTFRTKEGQTEDRVYTIPLADCPPYLITGLQYVQLSSDSTKMYSARPPVAHANAQFLFFTRREGENITLRNVAERTGKGKNGQPYKIEAHTEFTAILELVEGKWAKYQIPYNLIYSFAEYEGGIMAISGAGSKKLSVFLERFGMDFQKDTLPVGDPVQVLSAVEAFLIRARDQKGVKPFINIEDGWVSSISAPEEDLALESGFEEEEQIMRSEQKPSPADAFVSTLLPPAPGSVPPVAAPRLPDSPPAPVPPTALDDAMVLNLGKMALSGIPQAITVLDTLIGRGNKLAAEQLRGAVDAGNSDALNLMVAAAKDGNELAGDQLVASAKAGNAAVVTALSEAAIAGDPAITALYVKLIS